MLWNLSSFLRSRWLQSWKQPRAKTVLRGRPTLERYDERNPPSSLLIGLPFGTLAGSTPPMTGNVAPAATTSAAAAERSTNPSTTAASTANTTSYINTSLSATSSATATDSTGDPFSDPFADPFGGNTSNRPPAGFGAGSSGGVDGGSSGPASGSGGGGGMMNPTPPATTGSPNEALWQALNSEVGINSAPRSTTLSPTSAGSGTSPASNLPSPANLLANAGVTFEANLGQAASSVQFLARTSGYTAYISSNEITLLTQPAGTPLARNPLEQSLAGSVPQQTDAPAGSPQEVQLQLVGADTSATVQGINLLDNRTNYYIGNDPSKWVTNVPNYQSVEIVNAYQGVNVFEHAGANDTVETDYVVAPGVDPNVVKLNVVGAQGASIDAAGDLVVATQNGSIVEKTPNIYQELGNGRQVQVSGGFQLNQDGTYGFQINSYDDTKPLVIDPAILYTQTFSGRSPGNYLPSAIAVAPNNSGYAYITGYVYTSTTQNVAFVTALKPNGAVLNTTLLGGTTGPSQGNAIAVDSSGNVYVVGLTQANNFPTQNAWRPVYTNTTGGAGFLTKLNASLQLTTYSTYIEGVSSSGGTDAQAVAVDQNGDPYIVGITTDQYFPQINPVQSSFGGGKGDAFIVELAQVGNTAVYSSYIGGSSFDDAFGVALDQQGAAYVAGMTSSTDFPVTPGAYQTTYSGDLNTGFVAKVKPGGGSLVYATYLGGDGSSISGIAVTSNGYAYVAYGSFVAELNQTGTTLVNSMNLGATPYCLAISPVDGSVWVGGQTSGGNFPLVNPTQSTGITSPAGFLTQIDPTLSTVLFSTYAGGNGLTTIYGVAVDAQGNAYVAGTTSASNFPTTHTYDGVDGFVMKYARGIILSPGNPLFVAGQQGATTPIATFTVPGQITTAANFSAVINWGDGSTNSTVSVSGGTSVYQIYGSHTYTTSGPDTITVTVNDLTNTNTSASINVPITVAEAPISAQGVPDFSINQGEAISTTTLAALTDLNLFDTAGVFTGTINWGDDSSSNASFTTTSTAGMFNVVPSTSHTYANSGTYTIYMTLAHNSMQATASTHVTVNPPSGTLTNLTPANGGPPGGGPYLTTIGEASVNLVTGGLRVSQPLDFDLSPGTAVGGSPNLVYNTDTVNVEPILPVTLTTDSNDPVPSELEAQLTWNNGTPQPWVTFSTTGHSPGNTYLLAVQVASPVATTGLYPYTIEVKSPDDSIDATVSGYYTVVANNPATDSFGAGWSLDSLATLVPVTGGVLWVSGSGDARLFSGSGGTYTNPPGDFGILVQNADGSWTYTAKDDSKDNFDVNGRLTSVVDKHNLALTYTYDSSGQISTVAAPDGGLTTFNYSGTYLSSISEPGGRTVSVSIDGNGDLTGLTDADGSTRAFTYNSNHQLTSDQWGPLNAAFSYDSVNGRLTTIARGLGTTYTLATRQTQGLVTSDAASSASDLATITDPLGKVTTYTFDNNNQLVTMQTPAGTQRWSYDSNGENTSYQDADGNLTVNTYSNGNLVRVDTPDGGHTVYAYDSTFDTLTSTTDSLGNTTSWTIDPNTGDPLTKKDALGNTTSYTYYQTNGVSNGLLQTSTDPLGNVTTYTYDSHRRLSTITDPLGNVTTYAYDNDGNITTVTDPRGDVSTSTYDANNQLVSTIDGAGDHTSMSYDAIGDLTSKTDPRGIQTLYTYDQRGWQTTVTQAGQTTTTAYDVAGNITAVTDPLGNTTTYLYDNAYHRTTSIDPFGNRTTYTYDANGNVLTVRDPLNYVTTYTYDPANRRVSVTDPTGATTTTKYNLDGLVVSVTDPLGNSNSNAYDADNRVTGVFDALGNGSYTRYDADGDVTQATDPDGNRTVYQYDPDNRRTMSVDPTGAVTRMFYDAAGNLTVTVDPLGNVTTYAYDSANRKTQTIDALGNVSTVVYDADGNISVATDANGHSTTFAYDSFNRVTAATTADGSTAYTYYDADGDVTGSTDRNGNLTTYAYDADNRKTSSTDPIGRLTTMIYDADGRLTQFTDNKGNITTYSYNPSTRTSVAIDPKGNVTTSLYDADGDLIGTIDPKGDATSYVYDPDNHRTATEDPDGYVTTVIYDPAGNKVASVDADGNTTRYSYDADNRLVRTTDPQYHSSLTFYDADGNVAATINANGYTTSYRYDRDNRRTGTTDPTGAVTTTTFDPVGNALTTIDPTGKTTTYTYDAVNRQISVTDPLGRTTTTQYDGNGNIVSITDPNGNTTAYGYDKVNRRITTTVQRASGPATTTTGYDNNDNVTSVTDADGNVTLTTYDKDNNKSTVTDPLGNVTTYSYDSDDRLTLVTDADNRQITYSYDKDGRELGETWLSAPVNGVRTVDDVLTFTYDGNGNRLTASDKNGTVTDTYTKDNQVSVQTDVFGQTLTYSYDRNGNVTQVADSQGGYTTSTYDGNNRLTMRLWSSGGVGYSVALSYSPSGQLTRLIRFSGPTNLGGTTTYTYNAAGQVADINTLGGGTSSGSPGTLVTDFAYTYLPGGQVQTERDNGGAPLTFTYDGAYDVTSDGVNNYTYDAAGNRNNSGYVIGRGNELLNDGTWTYTYDDVGNQIEKSMGPNGTTVYYTYDESNHLIEAKEYTSPGGTLVYDEVYKYDATGNKIEQDVTQGGTTTVTRYSYDGDNIWADLNGSNTLQVRRYFLPGVDQVLARVDYTGGTPVTAWYLTDRQGSVRGILSDSGGTLLDFQSYDAFGDIVSQTNASYADRYGYTGRELDSLTGQQYNRNRWYNVSTGSWTTRDPLGFLAGNADLYDYVNNNAANMTDPTGLAATDSWTDFVVSWDNVLGNVNNGWFKQTSNFSAGMGDTVSGGLTAKVRQGLGYDDVVDYSSGAYRYGGYAGQAINIGLMVASPTGWAAFAARGITLLGAVSGGIDAVQQSLQGDFSGVGLTLLNVGLSVATRQGAPCNQATQLAKLLQKGMHVYGMVQGAQGAINKMMAGDYVGGLLSGIETGINAYRFMQSCFTAGTRLLTRRGWVAIEQIMVGDWVWSKPENEPESSGSWQRVEETFVRLSPVLLLQVGNRTIETTAEHPVYVRGQGWLPAGAMETGQEVLGKDGEWTVVTAVEKTRRIETVYNCRVAEFHTYFVGGEDWEFSVWAHNANATYGKGSKADRRARELRAQQLASSLDTGGGHSYADHGAQTTPSQHLIRLRTGITPSGRYAPTETSGRFISQEMHALAAQSAQEELWRSPNPIKANGRSFKAQVDLTFNLPGAGESYSLDTTGNLVTTSASRVQAIYRLDAAGMNYNLVTMYPIV